MQDTLDQARGLRLRKWTVACCDFVEHNAHAVNVGARVNLLFQNLFRSHVRQSTGKSRRHRLADGGSRCCYRGRLQQLRQTEIQNLQIAVQIEGAGLLVSNRDGQFLAGVQRLVHP